VRQKVKGERLKVKVVAGLRRARLIGKIHIKVVYEEN
jgi:hypothetical protein